MAKNTIFSFFEATADKIKELIEGTTSGTENEKLQHVNKEGFHKLEREIKSLENTLNSISKNKTQVTDIVQKENAIAENLNIGQIVFSDIIQLYKKLEGKYTVKTDFAMAYYYDVLVHKHYAQEANLANFNSLLETDEFKLHIRQIVEKNDLSRINKSLFLLNDSSVSNENKTKIQAHYDAFLNIAFELKFKTEKEQTDFFKLFKTESAIETPSTETLEDVLKELEELIGLKEVKNDVHQLINLLKVQKKRSAKGLKNADFSLHTVFLGPPGTGKTSVARLLGRIYKHLGFLTKGQVVETDREGMVAGFVGQTATKVNTLVEQSLGGVLFIDEAYALTQHTGTSDYGAEAVNTLLKRMEDKRKDFAVIVAGYSEPMKEFVESNPGLRSRFSRYFFFDHFLPTELIEIFELFCKKADFILSAEAKEKIQDIFGLMYDKKTENFGNARVARNLFEKCIQNHANRVVDLKRITQKALKTIEESDIPEPLDALKMFMDQNEED